MFSVVLANSNSVALVNDCDAEVIAQHRWWMDAHGYAVTRIDRVLTYMHRLIIGAERGQVVDHVNGVALDNQRANLRICTHAENMRNRKMAKSNKCGIKGVYWVASRQRYRAEIKANGKKYNLGDFTDAADAGAAYAKAAQRLHGEFAKF